MFDNLGISFRIIVRKDFHERASDKWTSVLPHHRDVQADTYRRVADERAKRVHRHVITRFAVL